MNVKLKYKPNINRIEIELTTQCNQRCFSCNRLCTQAPSDDMLTADKIDKFFTESMVLNKRWDSIALMGGEPFIHPEIDEILHFASDYKEYSPRTHIKVITNGSIDALIPAGIDVIKCEKEDGVQPDFGNVLLAPIDRFNHNIYSCRITAYCGIALTKYGYFPCGCGASVARVAGFDIGIKELRDVTVRSLKYQLKQLCQYCGRNLEYEVKCSEDRSISPFWRETLQKYRKEKPCLSQY